MALVEHAIRRSKPNKNGTDHIVSRRLQFVEIGKSGPRDGVPLHTLTTARWVMDYLRR